ncbi:phosphoribosyltransferase [Alcaligenes faecalis]
MEYNINHLVPYHRYWKNRDLEEKNDKADENTYKILDLKDKRPHIYTKGVAWFWEPLKKFIEHVLDEFNEDEGKFLPENLHIVIVPSSTPNQWSQGLIKLADKIINKFNLSDSKKALVRTYEIDKLSLGGDRSIHIHLDSIEINGDPKKIVKGKTFILFDDVTTTGNSLIACAQKLEEAGAAEVVLLAIGKTHED